MKAKSKAREGKRRERAARVSRRERVLALSSGSFDLRCDGSILLLVLLLVLLLLLLDVNLGQRLGLRR
jgi:hypothetical protein